jgi:hypothetical protein
MEEIVERFWESSEGQEMKVGGVLAAVCMLQSWLDHAQARMAVPFDKSKSHPAALVRTKYALSPLQVQSLVSQLVCYRVNDRVCCRCLPW